MATVVLTNGGDTVTIGGITFVNGDNDIDHEILTLMAKLGLVDGTRYPDLTFDLSGME